MLHFEIEFHPVVTSTLYWQKLHWVSGVQKHGLSLTKSLVFSRDRIQGKKLSQKLSFRGGTNIKTQCGDLRGSYRWVCKANFHPLPIYMNSYKHAIKSLKGEIKWLLSLLLMPMCWEGISRMMKFLRQDMD